MSKTLDILGRRRQTRNAGGILNAGYDYAADWLAAEGPGLGVPVPDDGYAWWYLDALSDDGRQGITVIAFVGSVFSPYYAAARRRGPTPAAAHCSLNVSLHGENRSWWAMTERGIRDVERDDAMLRIGPSCVRWDGESLLIDVEETCVPWPTRLRGQLRFTPIGGGAGRHVLDPAGRHRWHALAPRGRLEVRFDSPRIAWRGDAYLDSNRGDEPLEAGFRRWHWSRWSVPGGTAVFYDAEPRIGGPRTIALKVRDDGIAEALVPPPPAAVRRSGWGIARCVRSDTGSVPSVRRTLLDAPFYARSVVEGRIDGRVVTGIQESLDLDRFSSRIVQGMLRFRMPRRAR